MKCCYVENCSIATESDPRRPSEQPSLSEHCPVHSYLDLIPYLATTLRQKLRVTTLLSWEPTYFATFSMCCLSSSISFDMAACIHVEWCRYPVVGTNDVTFVFKRVELHVIAWSVCHQHKDTHMHIVFILVRICRCACKRVGTVLLNPSSCHQHKSIPKAAPTFSITDSNLLFDSVVAWA